MAKTKPTQIRDARGSDPIAFWFATWFGSGLSPQSPGTVGSIAALPVCYALLYAGPTAGPIALTACAIVLTLLGIVASGRVAKALNSTDPQIVVIDEVAGMCLTTAFAPMNWKGPIVALILFRLFDITKPQPCRWIERHLPPGPGIMLDDTVAACFAGIVLLAIRYVGWL